MRSGKYSHGETVERKETADSMTTAHPSVRARAASHHLTPGFSATDSRRDETHLGLDAKWLAFPQRVLPPHLLRDGRLQRQPDWC